MASQEKIQLLQDVDAQFRVSKISKEAADKASALLQHNHEHNDIFFNDEGFHSKRQIRSC